MKVEPAFTIASSSDEHASDRLSGNEHPKKAKTAPRFPMAIPIVRNRQFRSLSRDWVLKFTPIISSAKNANEISKQLNFFESYVSNMVLERHYEHPKWVWKKAIRLTIRELEYPVLFQTRARNSGWHERPKLQKQLYSIEEMLTALLSQQQSK